ncbi:restriction endonuclease [Candidatus Magnetomorum sp. HK-1]|nr:restriction endonuclease [Candidatus Magnetomorum sp. HK-1]
MKTEFTAFLATTFWEFYFRTLWQMHIYSQNEWEKITDRDLKAITEFYRSIQFRIVRLAEKNSTSTKYMLDDLEKIYRLSENVFPELEIHFHDVLYRSKNIMEVLTRVLANDNAPILQLAELSESGAISWALHTFLLRVLNLTPDLISSIKVVNQEYIEWLRAHPKALDTIAWEAFEKLIAEILVNYGFKVDLTGRIRNQSADIIAIRTDELGVDTRYLIECKRYSRYRKVGIDIVNSVLGAAKLANVEHAFLVTTSSFSMDVKRRENEFKDYRLHLRDGEDVVEWLKDYNVRSNSGLWLSNGWNIKEN